MALCDPDPFTAETRVLLGPADSVAPGATHDFDLSLTAPGTASTQTTDWQMLRENVQRFGQTAQTDPVVTCASPDAGAAADAEAVVGAADGGGGVGDGAAVGEDATAPTTGEDASSPAGQDAALGSSVDGGHSAPPVGGACGCASAPAGLPTGLGLLLAGLCRRRRHLSGEPGTETSRAGVAEDYAPGPGLPLPAFTAFAACGIFRA